MARKSKESIIKELEFQVDTQALKLRGVMQEVEQLRTKMAQLRWINKAIVEKVTREEETNRLPRKPINWLDSANWQSKEMAEDDDEEEAT